MSWTPLVLLHVAVVKNGIPKFTLSAWEYMRHLPRPVRFGTGCLIRKPAPKRAAGLDTYPNLERRFLVRLLATFGNA